MSPDAAGYDPFARMYDAHWGRQGEGHLKHIEARVLGYLPPGARILDLCCGTGQLAHQLTERGFRVLGLDASAGMLSYARKNAPQATFVQGDARDFRLEAPVDAVLCLFDSLNHLMRETDLASAFASVARALAAGGLFAFDLNMEAKYRHTWTGEFSVIRDHEVGLVRASVDPEKKHGLFDATLFYDEGDDRWSRHDVRLVQTWYGEAVVERLLAEVGFEAPAKHVKEPLRDDPSVAQNLLFVATKRA